MTNKEYKQARQDAESAPEIYTFEHWNGFSFYPNRYMTSEDLKDLRKENKAVKANRNAFSLDEFGNRALIIPVENGFILRSYYTDVAVIRNGEFFKLWNGFSVTTLKHINAFCRHFGFPTFSKREWIEKETV